MKLIVNADDLGLTAGVNQAVLLGVRRGVISSASLMVNQEGTEAAIQYLRSGLIPRAGIHLCITAGRPVSDPAHIPSLVDEQGFFHRPSWFTRVDPDPRHIVLEFEAQIEKVLRRGVTVTHLDTHHHIHHRPVVLEALIVTARSYGLSARHLKPAMREEFRRQGVATPDHFCGEWIGPDASVVNFFKLVTEAKGHGHRVVEVMTHPGLADDALAARSSYVIERQKELAVLCSRELRTLLDGEGVALSDYSASETTQVSPAGQRR